MSYDLFSPMFVGRSGKRGCFASITYSLHRFGVGDQQPKETNSIACAEFAKPPNQSSCCCSKAANEKDAATI